MPKRQWDIEVMEPSSKKAKYNKPKITITKSSSKPSHSFKKGYDRAGGYYGRFSGPQGELKFFDTAVTMPIDNTAEAASSAATGQLDLIPQGVTESTRVGRKCTVKSIQGELDALFTPGAGGQACALVRMMLVQDTQTNGAQATFADIYDGTVAPFALRNIENGDRFKILKTWNLSFNPPAGATTAYNNVIKRISFYKKCQIPLEFSSTTGAITELKSNHLFFAYGAVGSTSDDTVTVQGNIRLRYSDN